MFPNAWMHRNFLFYRNGNNKLGQRSRHMQQYNRRLYLWCRMVDGNFWSRTGNHSSMRIFAYCVWNSQQCRMHNLRQEQSAFGICNFRLSAGIDRRHISVQFDNFFFFLWSFRFLLLRADRVSPALLRMQWRLSPWQWRQIHRLLHGRRNSGWITCQTDTIGSQQWNSRR